MLIHFKQMEKKEKLFFFLLIRVVLGFYSEIKHFQCIFHQVSIESS